MVGASDQDLWEALPGKMKSWRIKGGCTKPSRWFSWNEAAADNLSEFAASRMVLEWYLGLGTDQSPDDIHRPTSTVFQGGRWIEIVLSGTFMGDLGKCTCDFTTAGALLGLLQPQLHEMKTVQDSLTETQSMSTGWSRHWSLTATANILVWRSIGMICFPGSRTLNNS